MSLPPIRRQPGEPTFLGHPRGLATLFLTEMWERFSFYGMRAILVLYLAAPLADDGLGLPASTAAGLYAIYNAMVYLLALPGGWVADRVTGARRAVLYGGVVIAAGHYTMAVPAGATGSYAGLALIAAGTGLLKPNISAMVGDLYAEDDRRRDAAFSIFYLGINLGAFAAPLITGYLGERVNWHLGFGCAGVGMTVGLVQYVAGSRHLGTAGAQPCRALSATERRATLRRASAGTVAVAPVLTAGVLVGDTGVGTAVTVLSVVAVAVPAGYFAVMLTDRSLTPVERGRVRAFLWIFLAATLFWLIFEQAGSLLTLFGAERTDRSVFGFRFPASWFQSVNPAVIVLLAPVFAVLWSRLGRRAPSTPAKLALGLLGVGASFVVMAAAALDARDGGLVSPLWLVAVFLVQSCAELLLSPVGLSASSKLAPARFGSQVMGLWFLASATGNALNTQVVKASDVLPGALYYGALGTLAVLAGLAFAAYRSNVHALMGGVDLARWTPVPSTLRGFA